MSKLYSISFEKLEIIKERLHGFGMKSHAAIDDIIKNIKENFNHMSENDVDRLVDEIALLRRDATSAEQPKRLCPLWSERPVKRGTNPAHWILEYHRDLIATEGARAAIGRRDPELIKHYSTWISPKRHPEDDLGLDARQSVDFSGMSSSEILEHKRKQVRESKQRAAQRTAGLT